MKTEHRMSDYLKKTDEREDLVISHSVTFYVHSGNKLIKMNYFRFCLK